MASDWTNNDNDNNDTALGFSLADVDTTPSFCRRVCTRWRARVRG